ncbi:hypothetical protein ACFL2Q_08470 [Thermodesulfobacteriota bacterium]
MSSLWNSWGAVRVRTVIVIVAIAIPATIGTKYVLDVTKTIAKLLQENSELRKAIGHLTTEDQIGYAKVLKQEKENGKLYTTLLFVETDRKDKSKVVLKKKYKIEGDIIHFDALVIKFSSDLVMTGKEKALYLWRRVYGEYMPPNQGFPIEQQGVQPKRYAGLLKKLSIKDRKVFWDSIWELANDPERLSDIGVTAIDGKVVYKQLQPGFIYVMKVGSGGDLFAEVVPIITDDIGPRKKKAEKDNQSTTEKLWDDTMHKMKDWYKGFKP